MSKQKNQFRNKIKDLQQDEFEHPEDFFTRATSLNETAAMSAVDMATMESTAHNLYTTDTPPSQRMTNADEMWIDTSGDGFEGQLAVDVYQDDRNVYVRAIVGGIAPEDIEVHLNNDMITIKGRRIQATKETDEEIDPENYYIQECYWGGFSRSIILPVDVQNEKVEAITENGVLTVTLPKSKRPKNSRIPIKEVR